MTELMRPASIRELVEKLPRPSLIYLCEQRGRPVSRANDDCRSSISRSFRGQRDELLATLRKEELLLLLSLPVRSGDLIFELPNAQTYTKRELQELAKLAFGNTGHLGEPFVLRGSGSVTPVVRRAPPPVEMLDNTLEEEPRAARGIGQAPAPEAATSDELLELESRRSGPLDARGDWSRLRPVRSLFLQLGLPVPDNLGQVEFADLIEALEIRGFEVATAGGARLTPLHDTVSIDAELRVRHDALAQSQASFLRTTPDRREVFARGQPVELSDYERASLRLELLVAGCSPEHGSRELFAKAIEIASAGLVIQPALRLLLERVATALARTPRDPLVVLTSLVRRIDSEDGEVLLREYAALHPGDDELHAMLSDHWSALCKSRGAAEAGLMD
jgi:hypothetical protein